jgi:hypothetical protein
MTTNTPTPIIDEIKILSGAASHFLECGKLDQVADILDEIEELAATQPAAPAEPLAAQLAAALAWSLETITECIRPDAEMWEAIEAAQQLIEQAQPSAADRAILNQPTQ